MFFERCLSIHNYCAAVYDDGVFLFLFDDDDNHDPWCNIEDTFSCFTKTFKGGSIITESDWQLLYDV
jgi:hypothetical protein